MVRAEYSGSMVGWTSKVVGYCRCQSVWGVSSPV